MIYEDTNAPDTRPTSSWLRWDAHACLPLHTRTSLTPLESYYHAGVRHISINVGMDFNPIEQIMTTIAHFRRQIDLNPYLCLAGSLEEIREAQQNNILSVAFDLEGSKPLLGQSDMLFLYKQLNINQIHFAYNKNNHAAGGCHDTDIPLTKLGKRFVDVVNNVGMIMDCAHTGLQSSLDIMERSSTPVVFSHANPRSLVEHPRNVNDTQLDVLAAQGGVICISGVFDFLGFDRHQRVSNHDIVERIIDHVSYVADRIGVEYVGIGLDTCFNQEGIQDNPINLINDYWWPSEIYGSDKGIGEMRFAQPHIWHLLEEGLSNRGFDPPEIIGILGENMARLYQEVERFQKF